MKKRDSFSFLLQEPFGLSPDALKHGGEIGYFLLEWRCYDTSTFGGAGFDTSVTIKAPDGIGCNVMGFPGDGVDGACFGTGSAFNAVFVRLWSHRHGVPFPVWPVTG